VIDDFSICRETNVDEKVIDDHERGGFGKMNLYDKAYELARAIQEGAEAQEWKAANAAAAGDPDAKRMLEDFRNRQMTLQQGMMEGREPSGEEMERMNKLYEVINLNPVIRRVLEAERRLSMMFEDINRIVGDALRDVIGEQP
jgi:cell fate (sporulation/competence/biofilm development) regulator YlbF (YheA/YmcA/DUF963 family)